MTITAAMYPRSRGASYPRFTAEQLAAALDAKPAGRGKWKARCVAHEDKHPSLWISESDSGRTLLKCWSGCTQGEVISALRVRGLWSGSSRQSDAHPISRPKPRDSRELRWLLDDVRLLSAEPEALCVWEFLRQAAELSPFALEFVSRVLRKERPSCQPLIRKWFDQYMEPTAAPDLEQVA